MIFCDYAEACPGHKSPDDRPCGYNPSRYQSPIARASTQPSPTIARLRELVARATPGADSPCQDMQYTSQASLRAEFEAALQALEAELTTLADAWIDVELQRGGFEIERDDLRALLVNIVAALDHWSSHGAEGTFLAANIKQVIEAARKAVKP